MILNHTRARFHACTHTTYREAKLSEDSDEEMETDPSAPNAPSAPPKTPKHDLMMVEEVRYVKVA